MLPVIEKLKELDILSEVDTDEITDLINKFNIKEQDYEKVARTIIYVRERLINKQSRYNSFKIAFPDRATGSRRAIETKAKRVEEYKIYKYLVSVMSSNTYILYAVDRMKVLDLALDKIMDENTKDRDKVEYMKMFLQETRKDEKDKNLEINIDINQNNVSITNIEDKLANISARLEGLSANDIIKISNGN